MKRTVSLLISVLLIMSLLSAAPFIARGVNKIRVACVGDSITEGFGREDPRSYPSALQEVLGDDYYVMNFGRGGTTLLSTGDFPYLSCEQYRSSLEADADVVLIMLGTNDGKSFNWVTGKNEGFGDELKALVNTYRSLPSHPVVYIMTSPTAFLETFSIVPENVDLIASLQRGVAEELDCPLIDMHALTADKSSWFSDNIHPTEYGYSMFAEIIADEFAADKSVPAAPVITSVKNSSGRSIVMWGVRASVKPILSYNLYLDGELYGSFTNTLATVKGLVNGKQYSVTVTAVNDNGESSPSAPFIIEPTATVPKVTGVADGMTYNLADGEVKATWTTSAAGTLDGNAYEQGTAITLPGEHILRVVNENVTVTVCFVICDSRIMPGDMDNDGVITVTDALAVLRIAARLAPCRDSDLIRGDMDGDRKLTVTDALIVLRTAAGLK